MGLGQDTTTDSSTTLQIGSGYVGAPMTIDTTPGYVGVQTVSAPAAPTNWLLYGGIGLAILLAMGGRR